MSTASGIGYHILHDDMNAGQRARLLNHLATIQPAVVNISGAENYPASLGYVLQVLETCPNTIVFERRVDRPPAFKTWNRKQDEGIWEIDVDAWYDWRVMPYLDVLAHPRVVVVYDNESNMGDFTPYAQQMQRAAERADPGVALGLGRFSTGTPGEHQYADQLRPMWDVLVNSRHWWTPNEYAGLTPQQSAGQLERYKHGLAQVKKKDRLNVAVGEFGLWLRWSRGLSETEKAHYYIALFQQWYQGNGVPLMVYAAENNDAVWRAQSHGEAFYRVIEARLGENQIPWPPKGTEAENRPIPEWIETRAVLDNMGGDKTLFVREGPSTQTPIVGRITAGKAIALRPPVEGELLHIENGIDFTTSKHWVPVRVDQVQGFAFGYFLRLPDELLKLIQPDPPVVIDEPPIKPDDTQPIEPVDDPPDEPETPPEEDVADDVCLVDED